MQLISLFERHIGAISFIVDMNFAPMNGAYWRCWCDYLFRLLCISEVPVILPMTQSRLLERLLRCLDSTLFIVSKNTKKSSPTLVTAVSSYPFAISSTTLLGCIPLPTTCISFQT